jgi:hypothetical protein
MSDPRKLRHHNVQAKAFSKRQRPISFIRMPAVAAPTSKKVTPPPITAPATKTHGQDLSCLHKHWRASLRGKAPHRATVFSVFGSPSHSVTGTSFSVERLPSILSFLFPSPTGGALLLQQAASTPANELHTPNDPRHEDEDSRKQSP